MFIFSLTVHDCESDLLKPECDKVTGPYYTFVSLGGNECVLHVESVQRLPALNTTQQNEIILIYQLDIFIVETSVFM